jgi:hypothetical protein
MLFASRTHRSHHGPSPRGRLPSAFPEPALHDPQTTRQPATLEWDEQGQRTLEEWTGTTVWSHAGLAPLPVRWVLTRDPESPYPARVLVCTDPTPTAEHIVRDALKRGSLDVTGEEGRAHVGIETPRHWSDVAIERSMPLLFGLSSQGALCGYSLTPDGQIPVAHTSWSRTSTATFRDVLALIRRHVWTLETFSISPPDPEAVFVPHSTRERLSLAMCSCVGHG